MSKLWKAVNRRPEDRAAALLEELSTDEKLAQLGCIFPLGEDFANIDALAASMPAGIGEVSTLEMRRLETLDACAAWQRKVQKRVMALSPHGIPAIFHMEGLCGPFLQDSASFPCGIARGAGWDPDLEEEIGQMVSRQEGACGITHIFAPVLDVARDPRMGRTGERNSLDSAGSFWSPGSTGPSPSLSAPPRPPSWTKRCAGRWKKDVFRSVWAAPPRISA